MSGWIARGLLLSALALGACTPPKATWVRRSPPRAVPPPARPAVAPPGGGGGHGGSGPVHVVQEGETLYGIARHYGVDVDELMDKNEISDPRTLAVGRELALPPQRQAAGGTPTRTASAVQLARPADPPPAAAASARGLPPLRWPVKGVVNSRFGPRSGSRHDGIDIGAPEGTPIHAAASGEAIFSGVQRGYGNLIILRHEGGWVTIYAHNRKNLVREGERVREGQVIGEVGRTGRATGPHVHFEVRNGTKPIDPQSVLPR